MGCLVPSMWMVPRPEFSKDVFKIFDLRSNDFLRVVLVFLLCQALWSHFCFILVPLDAKIKNRSSSRACWRHIVCRGARASTLIFSKIQIITRQGQKAAKIHHHFLSALGLLPKTRLSWREATFFPISLQIVTVLLVLVRYYFRTSNYCFLKNKLENICLAFMESLL